MIWPQLRTLIAIRLMRLADRLLGSSTVSTSEETAQLRAALGTITTLVPAEHPACRVAVDALGVRSRP